MGKVLGTIHTAVLTARTSKREHEVAKPSLHVTLHMGIRQAIDTLKEGCYLTVFLQEVYDGLVQTCLLLILGIAPWVMRTAAVKDIASTISTHILGYASLVTKTEHSYFERCVVKYLLLKRLLREECLQSSMEFWIFRCLTNHFAQVVKGWRYAGYEVWLALKESTITIGTQYLKCAQQHHPSQLLPRDGMWQVGGIHIKHLSA